MTHLATKKITKATFKSFVRKNLSDLFIKEKYSFNGMIDGIEFSNSSFQPAIQTSKHLNNTAGIEGVWLVGNSNDYFSYYEDSFYRGIEVTNSCGNFIIAISK